jgi:hypothetical protein
LEFVKQPQCRGQGDPVTSDSILIYWAKHMWFLSQGGQAELNNSEYQIKNSFVFIGF